jgi:hypothetical protein
MRVLILTTVLAALLSRHPLLAQEQGKPPVGGAQTTQAQGGTGASAKSDSQSNDEQRVMERLGPGMDWDHRKAGRDLQISPRRQGDDAKPERD